MVELAGEGGQNAIYGGFAGRAPGLRLVAVGQEVHVSRCTCPPGMGRIVEPRSDEDGSAPYILFAALEIGHHSRILSWCGDMGLKTERTLCTTMAAYKGSGPGVIYLKQAANAHHYQYTTVGWLGRRLLPIRSIAVPATLLHQVRIGAIAANDRVDAPGDILGRLGGCDFVLPDAVTFGVADGVHI